MYFDLNYESVPLLFFFLQGIVFGTLLLVNSFRQQQRASLWLGLWTILSCLYITPWMCGHAGWYAADGYREVLFFLPLQQFFFLGPLIFFYVSSLLQPGFRLRGKQWWHLVPGTLYLLYSLVVWVTDVLVLDEYYFYADGRDKDLAPWYQISGLAVVLYYVVRSLRLYQNYRKRIYDELSYADGVLFRWLRQFLAALFLIIFLRLTFLVLFPHWGDFSTKWYYYVAYALLAYFIGFRAYLHAVLASHLLPGKEWLQAEITEEEVEVIASSMTEEEPPTRELNLEERDRLQQLMEVEHCYLDPTLTLRQLASRMDIHPKVLSALINQGFGVNFNDFVNGYRVSAFKERVQDGVDSHLTLLGIALSCGFNSKTTFNRVFKRHTEQTPAEYLSEVKNVPQRGSKS
ncbi:MAG: AraC family transcriptional regulator [Bacteroidota bacterium]